MTLTPMQKSERDIEGLRQSIRQVFQDLTNSTLEPGEDKRRQWAQTYDVSRASR